MFEPAKPRDPRALNAYRHGLTGQVHILTPADQVAYDKHCQGIHESLAPVGAMEVDLVQSIADDRWRLKRAAAIESAIFALGMAEPDTVISGHEEVDAAFAQARVWLSEGKNLQLLSLYEHRIQRHVERNLEMLRQMQHDRRAANQMESAASAPGPFVFSNRAAAAAGSALRSPSPDPQSPTSTPQPPIPRSPIPDPGRSADTIPRVAGC